MRPILWCVSLIILLRPLTVVGIEENRGAADGKNFVRYGERPLQGDDFLAPVPEKRPVEDPRAEAYSETLVRYQYEYRPVKRAGKVRTQLTSIIFYAVFDRDKSWNAQPNNEALLEHHEGHFDLSQIAALEIELDWQKRLSTEKIDGVGRTETAARQDMEQKIEERLRGHLVSAEREHEYFDQTTRYGTDVEAEARERQRQRDRLQELEKEVATVRAKKGRSKK